MVIVFTSYTGKGGKEFFRKKKLNCILSYCYAMTNQIVN